MAEYIIEEKDQRIKVLLPKGVTAREFRMARCSFCRLDSCTQMSDEGVANTQVPKEQLEEFKSKANCQQ